MMDIFNPLTFTFNFNFIDSPTQQKLFISIRNIDETKKKQNQEEQNLIGIFCMSIKYFAQNTIVER